MTTIIILYIFFVILGLIMVEVDLQHKDSPTGTTVKPKTTDSRFKVDTCVLCKKDAPGSPSKIGHICGGCIDSNTRS